MDPKNIKKEYSNGEVTVVWQSGLCTHSANCVRNLSAVFKPKEQPWIQMDNASSEEIKNTVAKCPSGALSIKE
jgi:uncharacterized Fe-S cluster protein YjdI